MSMITSSLFTSLSICALAATALADTNTNRLAIYLPADDIPVRSLLEGKLNPGTVKLSAQPVIADADFVAYDRTNHTLEVTLGAAERLVKRLQMQLGLKPGATLSRNKVLEFLVRGMRDTPFVLVAFGRPVYVGVFTTLLSAHMFRLVPRVRCLDLPGWDVEDPRSVRLLVLPASGIHDDTKMLEALRSLGL